MKQKHWRTLNKIKKLPVILFFIVTLPSKGITFSAYVNNHILFLGLGR